MAVSSRVTSTIGPLCCQIAVCVLFGKERKQEIRNVGPDGLGLVLLAALYLKLAVSVSS